MAVENLAMVELLWTVAAGEINDCENLLVEAIGEREELTLAVVLTEAKPQTPITSFSSEDPLGELRLGGRPIQPDDTCRRFELVFDRQDIVSYTVLNESFGKYPELPEVFEGKLFRIFSHSHLLEFTRSITNPVWELQGDLKHYQIACLNHVVDVISTGTPKISMTFPSQFTPHRRLRLLGGSDPDAEYIPRRRFEPGEPGL
jgi:hypothetical protein